MQAIFGINGPGGAPPLATLPRDPIQQQPTYDGAKAAFERAASIRVLFDNGAGEPRTRAGRTRASSSSFDSFPIPGTEGRSWYLEPDGALADSRPAAPRPTGSPGTPTRGR